MFDSRPTVAFTSTTVAWPFSDFFQNFPKSLWNVQKSLCMTVGRRSRDLRPLIAWPFSDFFQKKFPIAMKRRKYSLFDSRPTVAWPPTTVTWPFSDFFQKNFWIAWNVRKIVCLTVGRWSRDLRFTRRTASHTASQMYISFIIPILINRLGWECSSLTKWSKDSSAPKYEVFWDRGIVKR